MVISGEHDPDTEAWWVGLGGRNRPSSGGEGREGTVGLPWFFRTPRGFTQGQIEPKRNAREGRGWGPQRPGDASNGHWQLQGGPRPLCPRGHSSGIVHPLFTFLQRPAQERWQHTCQTLQHTKQKGPHRAILLGGVKPNPGS